ncbi:acyl-CoA dehydrogenase family protein [Streptomyces sp. NRRL F-5126]|uniref:acyl-CoA dehydrogenase family protein n=1 Tax=Streptomyces sp. NRRL F-5126 TaxID=1463857 RepID=UPI00068E3D02|nr:acyl-CoA dehydrogenase family protein [Streptomyces sp. NRRL F-5126]
MSAARVEEAPAVIARRPAPRSLTEGARHVLTAVADSAEAVEAARSLDVTTADALSDAGFARHFVPTAHGGTGGTYRDFCDAVALLGEAGASAAWCASVYAAMGILGAHLPERGRAELWRAGPDTRIAGSFAPAGHVESVPGGWRLNGEWAFASGVGSAEWTFLGAMAPAGDGRQYRFFAVPRGAYRVLDTWHNVGLRGTGSNTVALRDVLVPEHRSFAQSALMAGTAGADPCHAAPYKTVNGLNFLTPALGAARAGLRLWSAGVAHKREVTGGATRDRGSIREALARSAAELDLVEMVVARAAGAADAGEHDGPHLARAQRDFAVAAELLTAVVDRLFRLGGARGQTEDSALQRIWRDVNCAAGHASLQFDPAAAAYARQAFAAFDTPRP